MPAKCVLLKRIVLNREVRTHIGRRLREHYDLARRISLPARLAELAKQFGQTIETNGDKHEASPVASLFQRDNPKEESNRPSGHPFSIIGGFLPVTGLAA